MSKLEELTQLKKLLDEGLITQEEYEQQKQDILSSPAAPAAPAEPEASAIQDDASLDAPAAESDLVAAQYAEPVAPEEAPKPKNFNLLEKIFLIVGWSLMGIAALGFIIICIVGAVEYDHVYLYDGYSSTAALCTLIIVLAFVGAGLALAGWILGVKRVKKTAGVRLVALIITAALVALSLSFACVCIASAAGAEVFGQSSSSSSSSGGYDTEESAKNAVKYELMAMIVRQNITDSDNWSYRYCTYSTVTRYSDGSYYVSGKVYVYINGYSYSANYYASVYKGSADVDTGSFYRG